MIKKLLISLTVIFLTSCHFPINTTDALDSFEYWYGADKPDEIEVFNGKYWRSTHFTLEYIAFLNFKSTPQWWEKMVEYNSLTISKESWSVPDDAPQWFKPKKGMIKYKLDARPHNGSIYFYNPKTFEVLFYEIQL